MGSGDGPERALVVGLAVTGDAVVRHLLDRGSSVLVVDDRPTPQLRRRAAALGVELVSPEAARALVAGVDVVLPTPGVPFAHPLVQSALDAGVAVWSELELAARADDRRLLAVTGTNGKTTVTTLVTAMLVEAGTPAVAAGNTDLPLVDALRLDDVDTFVVEASSFRLQFTESFRPAVGAWLNLSPDHLDWHPTLEHYAAAKARVWAAQGPADVAVANAGDPVVLDWAARSPGRLRSFGLDRGHARVEDGVLAVAGTAVARVADLPRRHPHDLDNALAACLVAMEAGVGAGHCRAVLERFGGLPHTLSLVGDAGGVLWYDDSKATTPASVAAAVGGFDSVVLIAGGRNKGLDLAPLGRLAPRLRGVVAIGESAPAVAGAFAGAVEVRTADSMDEAVARAEELARPGDAVLLSPGCASFDWYPSYRHRGDDFARAVAARLGDDLVPAPHPGSGV